MNERSLFSRESVLFLAISCLFFICIHAFDPFLAPYIKSLDVDARVMGIIIGATGLSTMLLRLPFGITSAVLNKRKLLIQIGFLFTAIAWPLAYLHPSAETLFFAKLADGVTSATWVIFNVMFVSLFPPLQAAAAIALLSVTSPIGTFIGISISGFVVSHYGPQSSFLVASTAAVVGLILITIFVREKKIPDQTFKQNIADVKEQISDKRVWLLSLLCAVVTMVPFATRDTLTPLLAQTFGLPSSSLAVLSGVHLACYALTTALCAPYFYRVWGLTKTAIIGGVVQGLVVIAIPYAGNLTVLFILQALAGASFGLILTVLNSMIVMNTAQEKNAIRVGLFQSVYSFGMFFGPVLVGYLKYYFSITVGFEIVGIIALVAVIFVRYIYRLIDPNHVYNKTRPTVNVPETKVA